MADTPDTPLKMDPPTDAAPLPPGHPVEPELEDRNFADLKADAAAKGVTPTEGSGKDGALVKDDLINALQGVPDPPAGRPPLLQVAEGLAAPFAPTTED